MNERERVPPELEPSVGELIDGAVRKLVTAIVIAGGLIALGLYWQPSPPRYQGFAADGRVYRIDIRRGTIIGCENNHCAVVLQRGQELEDINELPSPPKQVAPPSPTAPVPAPAPRAPPAQLPAPAQPQPQR